MSDLTDFLLARIAEDEATARLATPGPWSSRHGTYVFANGDTMAIGAAERRFDVEHIARHDPACVLAECEAKRRIVEHCADDPWNKYREGYVLEFLAAIYADHPDYREEWRP